MLVVSGRGVRGHLSNSLQAEHVLEYGVDELFFARAARAGDFVESLYRASDFLILNTVPPFHGRWRVPGNVATNAVYTRHAYRYPMLKTESRFIDPPALASYNTFLYGLENGAGAYNGLLAFFFFPTRRTQIVVKAHRDSIDLDIGNIFPPDNAVHSFSIWHGKYLTVFLIDHRPVAFVVQTGFIGIVKGNVPPYALLTFVPLAESYTGIIEFASDKPSPTADAEFEIGAPYTYRISEGKESIPLTIPLYIENTNTRLQGSSISVPVGTHPFPVAQENRVLVWRSTGSGTIEYQVLTSRFTFETVASFSYFANTTHLFELPRSYVGRIVVNPATTQTVNTAEVHIW